jgi:tetratricopeptide (TPR) repeat protein
MFSELRARIGLGQADEIPGLIAQVRRERGPAEIKETARELLAHGLADVAREVLEEEVRRFETDPFYADSPSDRSEVLYWLGREEEAYALAQEGAASNPESPWDLAWVGILAPFVGDTALAWEIDQRIAEWPREDVPVHRRFNFPWVRAQIHASLGDREGAVRLLEEVYQPRGEKIFSINDHITVELFPLRGYEPFEDLIRPND